MNKLKCGVGPLKRSEFFAEMGKGLLKTVKELTAPFVEDDLQKLDSFVDELSAIKWQEIGAIQSFTTGEIHDLFLNKIPIALLFIDGQFYAYKKICPTCQTMVQWIAYDSKFKCMSCEKEYYIETEQKSLSLKKYPIKKSNNKLFIGIN